MASYYVDNNETIYALHSVRDNTVASGGHLHVPLGLSDLTGLMDLSGQSTWLINRIHFFATIYTDNAVGLTPDTSYYYVQGGICPSGTLDLVRVAAYQDLKGWPLKGVNKYIFTQVVASIDNQANSRGVYSKTWTPSRGNHLALNRGQDVNFTVNTVSSNNTSAMFGSVLVEARRGN